MRLRRSCRRSVWLRRSCRSPAAATDVLRRRRWQSWGRWQSLRRRRCWLKSLWRWLQFLRRGSPLDRLVLRMLLFRGWRFGNLLLSTLLHLLVGQLRSPRGPRAPGGAPIARPPVASSADVHAVLCLEKTRRRPQRVRCRGGGGGAEMCTGSSALTRPTMSRVQRPRPTAHGAARRKCTRARRRYGSVLRCWLAFKKSGVQDDWLAGGAAGRPRLARARTDLRRLIPSLPRSLLSVGSRRRTSAADEYGGDDDDSRVARASDQRKR